MVQYSGLHEASTDGEMDASHLSAQCQDGRLRFLSQMEKLDGVADETAEHALAKVDDLAGEDALHPVLPARREPLLDVFEKFFALLRVGLLRAAALFYLHRLGDELPGELFGLGPGLSCEYGGRARIAELFVDEVEEGSAVLGLRQRLPDVLLVSGGVLQSGRDLFAGQRDLREITCVQRDLGAAGIDAAGGELLREL